MNNSTWYMVMDSHWEEDYSSLGSCKSWIYYSNFGGHFSLMWPGKANITWKTQVVGEITAFPFVCKR